MTTASHVVPRSSMETEALSATGDMLERNAEIRALIEAGELVGSIPQSLPVKCLHAPPAAMALLPCRCQTHWLVMLFLISFLTLRRAMAVGC